MAQLTIVYWRDIPAQVIVKAGRQNAKRQLSERFEKAIDRAAMRADQKDTDSYLAEWRRAEPIACGDDLEAEARAMAEKLAAGPGMGLAVTKRMLNAEAHMDLGEAMQAEGWVQAECMKHPDYRESYDAFVEKRSKDFVKNRPGSS